MYHVAIFNERQHEQFEGSADRFALRKSRDRKDVWTPVWEHEEQLATSDLLFCIADDRVTFEIVPKRMQTRKGFELRSGDSFALPCLLRAGDTWLEIAHSDAHRKLVPLLENPLDQMLVEPRPNNAQAGPSSATVAKWLKAAGQLHRSAAGSAEFYADAARYVVEKVELDSAWILRRADPMSNRPWQIVGSHLPHPERGVRFDQQALEQLEDQSETWFQPTPGENDGEFSQAIVVSPVLDHDGQLIAAVYGVRDTGGANRRRGVRPLEAQLVQLLAESVAVGIARLQQETEAARTRVLLEHAFSPTVAEYIQQHPDSLSGQERNVTLMFADLRGYTTLAETLNLTDCYDLLGDVMEVLTQIVMRQKGIVVDYYGDGLLALWNAPLEQPNHADLACTAAAEMFAALPAVTEAWKDRMDAPLELGIGIHSGPAFVGNAGTRSRLKYGPRGNTVNVASRVQSASKQLQLPLVITSATQTKLSDKFFTLRVCTAKLPGLERPAELFTVYPASEAEQVKSRLDQYSQALAMFEAGDMEAAEDLLNELASHGPATPAHFLAHYTAAQKHSNQGRRAVDKYATQQGPVIEIYSK